MEAREVSEVRAMMLDPGSLVRATARGRAPGRSPRWRRVDLRPVELGAGPRLQVTRFTATQAFAANHPWGSREAAEAVDELMAEGFAEWVVDTGSHRARLRARSGGAFGVAVREREEPLAVDTGHDRAKARVLPADHPVLRELGLTTPDGRVKPSRQAKWRQVEEFLRLLEAALAEAGLADRERLRVVDLGCGNAYLTFAAHAALSGRGTRVEVLGVDVKEQSRQHNEEVAARLGVGGDVTFVAGAIAGADLRVGGERPDVVLALHACDTASDDAIAAGVRSGARLLLVAPCCHHDLQRQLTAAPTPYEGLLRHGILRQRWGDVLTDTLRAEILSCLGHRVDVVEFVGSQHTPRNTLIRAIADRSLPDGVRWANADRLMSEWGVVPRLSVLLAEELSAARAGEVHR